MSTAAYVLPSGVRRRDVADSIPARVRHDADSRSHRALRRAALLTATMAVCAAAFFGTRAPDAPERPTIRAAAPAGIGLVVTIPAIRLDLGSLLGLEPAPAAAPGCD
jgi:hypothetical protein